MSKPKPTFRFEINLKKKSQAPPPEPQEVNQVADARKWEMEIEKKLREIPPATIIEDNWDEDPLTAQELLAAYNASLQRCQRVELGMRVESTIEYSVFIDEWENKHVVTQPLGAKGSRISELMVSLDGIVLRLSLERFSGEILNLDGYMGIGLTEMPDEELKRIPGYYLQITRYLREGDYLVAVEQVRKHYDVASNRIINDQEFTLS
jgi:hypothetical protein